MEKTLKLRKPSMKKLVDLLIVAEEMLFSFPVPSDLRCKYERMRSETFTKLRIRQNSIPFTTSSLEQNQGQSSLNKVLVLELINHIQQSTLLIDAFEEELAFKTVTLKNIFNSLSEKDKIDLKSVRSRKNEDIENWVNLEFEQQLEKFHENLIRKKSIFIEIKQESLMVEEKIMKELERQKKEDLENRKEKDMKGSVDEGKVLNEQVLVLTRKLEKVEKEKMVEKEEFERELEDLKKEVKKVRSIENSEKTEKNENKMLEIVTLKQKLADLEINYTKSTKISENLQEINSQLTASNGLLKDKNLKLESKYNQLQSTLIQIEKTLEYERNTFDSKLKLLQSEIMTQQVRLKEIQDENIENLTEIHRHELQENSKKYEQEVDNLKEEVNHYKQKLTKIEDSNKQIVKSLQIEVLRAKETASRQSDELNDKKFKGFEQIIEKLENRVICIQNSMKYVIQLLSPIYEAHSNSQQDWDENQVVSQIDLNEQDYTDIIVLSEFVVFLLEKTMKDKTWLINKLQEVHSESKISKTNSVGTLASPSSFRDNGLFRQIWKDVKETSLVLEKFERCRENLVSQFIHK